MSAAPLLRGVGLALALAVALAMLAVVPAHAVEPDEVLADRALETRARSLSKELRCMVCQNQSIDDSDAPLARDLRILVRERLKAGDSDREVVDYLVSRYGEFVLLRPRFSWETALLWLAPVLVLLGGALIVWRQAARAANRGAGEARALTAAEKAHLARLTRTDDP